MEQKPDVRFSKLFWMRLLHRRKCVKGVKGVSDGVNINQDRNRNDPGTRVTNSLLRKLDISEKMCMKKVSLFKSF